MNQTVRVIALVVDITQIILYKESGETIVIAQGDTRVPKIIETANQQISRQGYADIHIGEPEINHDHFQKVEASSNGLIKFFRIAKKKVAEFFNVYHAEPQIIGKIPEVSQDEPKTEEQPVESVEQKRATALAEIMAHAIPSTNTDFGQGVSEQKPIAQNGLTPSDKVKAEEELDDGAENTIVAVVDGAVIPGMEKLNNHFVRAAKLGSQQGVENLLKRLSTVIKLRKHTVDDLLRFLERGDLPIADDGSIVIYKVLRSHSDGVFVDCHTRNVTQKVGSYVHMDISLVDHNRREECSNGLHVARRGYIREFSGDVCVIAKLAPEDVIAVPLYDANKMRVCGYHIIQLLGDAEYTLLKQNKPITGTEKGKVLLAKVLRGDHIGIIEHVKIGGHRGTDVTTTPAIRVEFVEPTVIKSAPVETKAEAFTDEHKDVTPVVNPKDVIKANTIEKALSKKEQAVNLYKEFHKAKKLQKMAFAEELIALKKASKKSWDALGITAAQAETLLKAIEKK